MREYGLLDEVFAQVRSRPGHPFTTTANDVQQLSDDLARFFPDPYRDRETRHATMRKRLYRDREGPMYQNVVAFPVIQTLKGQPMLDRTKTTNVTANNPIMNMQWSREEMLSFPPVKFNREVERHAVALLGQGYNSTKPEAAVGYMVAYVEETGKFYRWNGNTRSHLDVTGRVQLPPVCFGTLTYFRTMADLLESYNNVDNSGSVKGAVDRAFSAFKYNRMPVKSKLFAGGRGTMGIAVAFNAMRGVVSNGAPKGHVAIAAMFKALRNAIMAIDGVLVESDVTSNKVATFGAVIAAMVLSYMSVMRGKPTPRAREIAQNDWASFWCDFHDSKGVVGDGRLPHNKAWNIARDAGKGGKREEIFDATGKILHCFERREENRIDIVRRIAIDTYMPIFAEGVEADES